MGGIRPVCIILGGHTIGRRIALRLLYDGLNDRNAFFYQAQDQGLRRSTRHSADFFHLYHQRPDAGKNHRLHQADRHLYTVHQCGRIAGIHNALHRRVLPHIFSGQNEFPPHSDRFHRHRPALAGDAPCVCPVPVGQRVIRQHVRRHEKPVHLDRLALLHFCRLHDRHRTNQHSAQKGRSASARIVYRPAERQPALSARTDEALRKTLQARGLCISSG